MKYNVTIFVLLSLMCVTTNSYAAPLVIQDGEIYNYTTPQDFGNNTSGSGITSNGASATINTDGNISSNKNTAHGIYMDGGGKVSINGTGNNTFSANENKSGTNAWQDSMGIRLTGKDTELTIKDMNIDLKGNYTGALVNQGSKLNIISEYNNTLTVTGNASDRGYGLYAQNANSVINITGMNIVATGNKNYSIVATGGGKININSGNDGRNTVLINGSSPSAEGAGSELNFKGVDITSLNGPALRTYSNGKVTAEDVTIDAQGKEYAVTFSRGGGEISVANSYIVSASDNLINFNTSYAQDPAATAYFKADDSYLSGRINSSKVNVISNVTLNNSAWVMKQNSKINQLNLNSSIVDLRNTTGYNTLTLDDYVANNAVIYFNTLIDSEGTSTDKIIISNSSTGDTLLYINPVGEIGSPTDENGILLIDQSNASVADANFTLYGGMIDGGAYEYILDHNANQNWYLKSTDKVTSVFKSIGNVPTVQLSIIKTGMDELRKRMGELRHNYSKNDSGLWVRSYGKNLKLSENVNSKLNIFGVEAGYDQMIYSDCDDKVYLGLMAGYMYTDNIKSFQGNGNVSSGFSRTPSFGAYATWMNYKGWFADATLRHFFSRVDMTSYDSLHNAIKFTPDRQFTAGGLEFGRQLNYAIDEHSGFVVEPKVLVGYAYANNKSFRTNRDYKGEYHATQSITTKASIMLGYNKIIGDKAIEPFVQFGVIHEWDGVTDVEYAGGQIRSNQKGTSLEYSTGINAKLDNNWAIYTDVAYEKGSIIEAFSGNLGVRYNF